jgi:hypothetical protein
MQQRDLYTTVLAIDALVSTDGAGAYAGVFTSNPNSTGLGACPGWASLAAVFDEYRTLAFEVEFLSVYDQLISGASNVLTTVIDYDTATALGSYATADNYASQRMFSVQEYDGKMKKVIARMTGVENSLFTNTAAPTALYWIKFYIANMAINSQILHLFVRYRVQFRGRGV